MSLYLSKNWSFAKLSWQLVINTIPCQITQKFGKLILVPVVLDRKVLCKLILTNLNVNIFGYQAIYDTNEFF